MKILKSRAYTELIVKDFQVEWVIENLSSFQKNQGEYISSEFEIEMGNEKMKWAINFYPKGLPKVEGSHHISAYLSLISPKRKFVAEQQFILYNTRGKQIKRLLSVPRNYSVNENWGWTTLISRQALLQQLPEDKLRFLCKLKVCQNARDSIYLLPVGVTQLQSSIIADMNRIYTDAIFSDVLINVCGTHFEAHKLILAARCTVFYLMFKTELSETKSNTVDISDIRPEVFKEFLDYVYTGKVENEDLAGELLAAAEKYDVQDLKSLCEEILGNNTSVENCVETLALSFLYSAKRLKKQTMEFFVAHADKLEIPKLRLSELSHSCIAELLEAFVNQKKSETKIPIAEFTFEWTLSKISFSAEDICIASPTLCSEKFEEESWKIRLYPKKKNQENEKNYLSIYLQLLSSKRDAVCSKFSFSLQNIKGKEIAAFTSDSFQVFNTRELSIHGKENLVLTDEIFKEIVHDKLKIIVSTS